MNAHELMIKTNHYLIKGGQLTDAQKANIVRQLLSARSDEATKQRFYKGVRYPGNADKTGGGHMYPVFFITPYNGGKKLQTVIPMSPGTHILAANSYELEIIRLLHMFAPENPEVRTMVKESLRRLKTTCYGYHDCAVGECFHSAFIVLRFVAATDPSDGEWIGKLIRFARKNLDDKMASKYVHGNVMWYYWLCLSELPIEFAKPEIEKYKEKIAGQLSRSYVMNSESDRENHPVMICAIRNALSRLPEYAHIADREPYVSEKDGRLYFDIT
jgi:hypothetical protein